MVFTESKPIRWGPIGNDIISDYNEINEKEQHATKIFRRDEYYGEKEVKKIGIGGLERLESLERAFTYLFENSDLKLGIMYYILLLTHVIHIHTICVYIYIIKMKYKYRN